MIPSTIKLGSKGEDVKKLQTLLGNLVVDGIFGKKTKSSVMAYQAANSLSVDGIVGANTWSKLLGITPSTATYIKPVDYKQYDSKWASVMYSNHGDKKQTIKSSGCGLTAMADIVATLINGTVTPVTLCDKALKWGDRSYSNGTNWSFFKHIQAEYGFSKMVQTTSLSTLKSCLDTGGYAVCSMSKGYWTNGGHYITAWKYDDTYVYCNDPASSTRVKQKQSEFVSQRKAFFCFWK